MKELFNARGTARPCRVAQCQTEPRGPGQRWPALNSVRGTARGVSAETTFETKSKEEDIANGTNIRNVERSTLSRRVSTEDEASSSSRCTWRS